MKKIILITLVCALGIKGLRAENEERVNFVPSQGQFSVGFDVSPIFRFVGNMFNNSDNVTLDPLSGTPVLNNSRNALLPAASIMGRYMFTDNIAFIANIGVLGNSVTTRMYVRDDRAFTLDPLNNDRLIDVRNVRQNGFSMMLGGEYRIGQNRVQGIFGGGLMFASVGSRTTYEWANAMTDINRAPTTSWGQLSGNSRTLEVRGGSPTIFWGLATHAGAEFFLAPGISIGATVNLYILRENGAQTYTKTEWFNTGSNQVETWTALTAPGNRATRWGTDNLGGSLFIAFYF